jgi:hypothetical protein
MLCAGLDKIFDPKIMNFLIDSDSESNYSESGLDSLKTFLIMRNE